MAEGTPSDSLEAQAQVQAAWRTKRFRLMSLGLVTSMTLLVAVVVLSPLKEQYDELDPYKANSGASELLQYDTVDNAEQDPFQSEQLLLKQDSETTSQSSRDLAALRLLQKARYGGRSMERSSPTGTLWVPGTPTRELAEMRLQHKAQRAAAAPINNARASKLLEKARAGLAKRGSEIQELIASAKKLDSELPLLPTPNTNRIKHARRTAVRSPVQSRKTGLYFTPGGYGPYPADTGAAYLDDWSDEEAPAVAEVTMPSDDADNTYQTWGRYPEGEEEEEQTSFSPAAAAAIGAAVTKQSPLDWFQSGPSTYPTPVVVVSAVNHPRPQSWDDGRDEEEEYETPGGAQASAAAGETEDDDYSGDDNAGEKTPVLDRVKKLIDLKKKSEDIEEEQERVMDDIYDDAENGDMARVGGGPEAKAFSTGFVQGAVEASKKSLQQQAEFDELLRRQEEVVNRLEDAVWELEEHQREENWAKTASQYPDEQQPPPPAVSTPAATPAPAPAAAAPAAAAPPAKKLTIGQPDAAEVPFFDVDFYMEAMCPGCQHFAVEVLPAVLDAFEGQMRLRAIPYGNAAVVNGTVKCQHGADECMGNKIELCMMKKYPRWTTWFPAFKCIESSEEKPLVAARTCLPEHAMDADDVIHCANSTEGDVMQLQAGNETVSLKPPHDFTPWIVVNGEPVGERVMDLMGFLCDKLPEVQRGSVGACAPSKFRDVRGAQTLKERRHLAVPPKGLCYPSLHWDGTK